MAIENQDAAGTQKTEPYSDAASATAEEDESSRDRRRGSHRGELGGESVAGETEDSFSEKSIKSKPSDLEGVCLCQPDPKVPRPRNAFILFRQHYQSEVAKKHPGAANPEISKIIGQHWRDASDHTKARWKALADEEKLRHQKQYPNYRYQPRRAGRASADSPESEGARCSKCGGRSMASRLPTPTGPPLPNTPLTPAVSSAAYRHPSYASALSPPYSHSLYRTFYGRGERTHRDSGYGSLPYIHVPKPEEMDAAITSPEAKRRRYDGAYLPGVTRASSISHTMHYYPQERRRGSVSSSTPLPRPDFMPQQQKAFSVPPPPQLRPVRAGSPLPQQSSVKLAPLHIHNASSPTQAVEAMVMSIPPLNKIKVLSKISPPMPPPSLASPPPSTRGAVIAVEGRDDEAIKTVITHLKALLEKDDEHRVKVFYGGRFSSRKNGDGFSQWLSLIGEWHKESQEIKRFITTPVGFPHGTSNGFADRPRSNSSSRMSPRTAISKSHSGGGSGDDPDAMDTSPDRPSSPRPRTEHAAQGDCYRPPPGYRPSSPPYHLPRRTSSSTTATLLPPPPPSPSTYGEINMGGTRVDRHAGEEVSNSVAPAASIGSDYNHSHHPESGPGPAPMPVAIIPKYQLALTDTAASSVPISDEYSPTDHWQWMATLWRGIVGPDVTVLLHISKDEREPTSGRGIRGADNYPPNKANNNNSGPLVSAGSETGRGSAVAGGGGGGGGIHAGDELDVEVDVRLKDCKAVVLRCERDGKVPEKGLRRVGFEVGEWLRGMGETEREREGRKV